LYQDILYRLPGDSLGAVQSGAGEDDDGHCVRGIDGVDREGLYGVGWLEEELFGLQYGKRRDTGTLLADRFFSILSVRETHQIESWYSWRNHTVLQQASVNNTVDRIVYTMNLNHKVFHAAMRNPRNRQSDEFPPVPERAFEQSLGLPNRMWVFPIVRLARRI
jgi:hypothetical protein